MIPGNATLLNLPIEFVEQPSKTYKMNLYTGERVQGYTDGLEAIKQAVYKILNTERYSYIIYSWNYGIELKDLFGQAMSYVCPELERRVTEALTQDTRITAVTNFEFDTSKRGVLSTTFTVYTDLGSFEAGKELEV